MPETKKEWAKSCLREKHAELGRMPTKKDFDEAVKTIKIEK